MGSYIWYSIFLTQLGHHLLKDVLVFEGGQDIAQIGLIIFLVLLSGLFSGLNLGLMSLDQLSLEIVIGSGTAKESKFAKRIYPIRKRGNLLLCTILLGNVSVNTLLSILMASFTSGMFGFLASTGIIVVFGEILPQAFCSRHSLTIGYYSVWIVWIFLIVLLPLSYPISKILDFILGRELGTIYTRDELKKLLDIHSTYSDITKEETSILSGALDFSSKTVEQVMTPIADVFMIDIDEELNSQTIKRMLEMGYSRIPVYEKSKDNIVNLFYMKDLALINPDNCFKVREIIHIIGRKFPKVPIDTKLSDMLNIFKSGRSHISIVRRYVKDKKKKNKQVDNNNVKKKSKNINNINNIEEEEGPVEITIEEDLENPRNFINVGVVTLEDIIEEILQSEINDETDLHLDNRTMIKLNSKGRNKEVNYSLIESTDEEEELAVKVFNTLRKYTEFEEISTPLLQSVISQSTISQLIKEDTIYQYDDVYDYCTVLVIGSLRYTVRNLKKNTTKEENFVVSKRDKEGICFGLASLLTEDDDENWVSDLNVVVTSDDAIVVKISKRAYFAALQATQFQTEEEMNNDEEDNF